MKFRSHLGVQLLATLFVGLIKLLFRTVRLSFREETPGTNPYAPATTERFLYCVWHDSIVIPAFAGTHPCTAALTSRHTDGSFVAHVLRGVGIQPIRGSTGRLGLSAFRQLLAALQVGHLVITPDGPRGPARQMSVGIVALASRTGQAIVPTAYHAHRAWRFAGNWTDLIIPRPFTRVWLLAGKPIHIPPDLAPRELQDYAQVVQREMDRLSSQAAACC